MIRKLKVWEKEDLTSRLRLGCLILQVCVGEAYINDNELNHSHQLSFISFVLELGIHFFGIYQKDCSELLCRRNKTATRIP